MMPRQELSEFALVQEFKLRQNDHKRHWLEAQLEHLMKRLIDEVSELDEALRWWQADPTRKAADNVLWECADVANFAMFVWDKVRHEYPGVFPAPTPRQAPQLWYPALGEHPVEWSRTTMMREHQIYRHLLTLARKTTGTHGDVFQAFHRVIAPDWKPSEVMSE